MRQFGGCHFLSFLKNDDRKIISKSDFDFQNVFEFHINIRAAISNKRLDFKLSETIFIIILIKSAIKPVLIHQTINSNGEHNFKF